MKIDAVQTQPLTLRQPPVSDAARQTHTSQGNAPAFTRCCFPVGELVRRAWNHIANPTPPLHQRTMADMWETDNANWFHGQSPFVREQRRAGDQQSDSSAVRRDDEAQRYVRRSGL